MISRTVKEIGGRTIEITRAAATEQLDLQLSIAKVAGQLDTAPLLAVASGNIGAAVSLGITQAIGSVAKNLTHAELVRLMNLLFKYVHIDGRPFRDINADFADRPLDLWMVFVEAIKHNLGPFFDGLRQGSSAPTPDQTPTQ